MRYALQNLRRSRRRTLFTFLAAFCPAFILVLMFGMIAGQLRGMFESATELETGHFQLQGEEELAGGALPLIELPEGLLTRLSESEGIEFWTVRLDLPALAASEGRSHGVLVQGVLPQEIGRISPIPELISQGRYIEGPEEAVVGEALARLLHLQIGDRLVLLSAHSQAGMGAGAAKVVGIFQAPQEELGRTLVQVHLETARKLVRRPRAVTSVVGFVSGVKGPWDAWRIDRLVEALRARLPKGLTVKTFRELAPEVAIYMRIARPVLTAFSAIFFVLGGLVVLNTFYLSVLERTRELGVIRALGASRRWLMGTVFAEAGLLSAAGAFLGALSSAGVIALVEHFGGLRMPGAYSEFLRAFGMEPVLHLRITPWEVLGSALAMVGVALVSAWYPAHKAAGLEPVEAMRHVA